MPLLSQTGRSGGLHKRLRKALDIPVGHKQADRVIQFLLKGRWNRFSMDTACQQYIVGKRGHRLPLIKAQFALVHVVTDRDGTFQRTEGFLRLFAAHHF